MPPIIRSHILLRRLECVPAVARRETIGRPPLAFEDVRGVLPELRVNGRLEVHEVRWVFGICVLLKAHSDRQDRPLVTAVLHLHIKDDGATRVRKTRELDDPRCEPDIPQLVADCFEHWSSRYGCAANVDREEIVPA